MESKDMMPYLPMSFWQEFVAQTVVGPTPPYEMDNSLMTPLPSPKKTLIPELTMASAFCCLWACRKADTNSHCKRKERIHAETHCVSRQGMCVLGRVRMLPRRSLTHSVGGWMVSSQSSCLYALTPSTWERDCIWRQDLQRGNSV